jgi:hypothetical protein
MDFSVAFNAAFCWAGREITIATGCMHCKHRFYFQSSNNDLEVGLLAASPIIDPLPGKLYPITVSCVRNDHRMTMEYAGRKRELPSSYLYTNPDAKT